MTRRPRLGPAPLLLLLLLPIPTGCAGGKKQRAAAPTVSAAEAYEHAIGLLERRNLRQALTALKRIDFGPDTRETLEPLTRLAIADATFYQGNDLALIDARNLYLDFVVLFGGHPLAPYAQLQVGACSLEQVSHPSRDQSQALQAIHELEEVVRRWPGTRWAHAAQGMLRKARWNLAESEHLVGRFYLRAKAYQAAANRFRPMLDFYPDYPELDDVLFDLGQACLKSGKPAEGREHLERLVREYPESDRASAAKGVLASVTP